MQAAGLELDACPRERSLEELLAHPTCRMLTGPPGDAFGPISQAGPAQELRRPSCLRIKASAQGKQPLASVDASLEALLFLGVEALRTPARFWIAIIPGLFLVQVPVSDGDPCHRHERQYDRDHTNGGPRAALGSPPDEGVHRDAYDAAKCACNV